jgi:hypothetical protein
VSGGVPPCTILWLRRTSMSWHVDGAIWRQSLHRLSNRAASVSGLIHGISRVRFRHRPRLKTNLFAHPTRMLQRCALRAAHRTPRTAPQLIARRILAPSNDQRRECHRRVMAAFLTPYPAPGIATLKLAESRARPGRLRFGPRSIVARQPSGHRTRT